MNDKLILEHKKVIEDINYLTSILDSIEGKELENVKNSIKALKRYKTNLLSEIRNNYLLEMERNEEFRKVKNKVLKKMFKTLFLIGFFYFILNLFFYIFAEIKINQITNNNVNITEIKKTTLEMFNNNHTFVVYLKEFNNDKNFEKTIILDNINNKNYYYEPKDYKDYKIKYIPNFIFKKMNNVYKEYNKYNGYFINKYNGNKIKKEDLFLEELLISNFSSN